MVGQRQGRNAAADVTGVSLGLAPRDLRLRVFPFLYIFSALLVALIVGIIPAESLPAAWVLLGWVPVFSVLVWILQRMRSNRRLLKYGETIIGTITDVIPGHYSVTVTYSFEEPAGTRWTRKRLAMVFAWRLQAHGVTPNAPVAVFVEPGHPENNVIEACSFFRFRHSS